MIFSDERTIYNDEQETLSVLFENKSRDEVYDLLEDYKAILVKRTEPSFTGFQRVMKLTTMLLLPLVFLLSGVKWVCTGDKYLDSWFKKLNLRDIMDKYFL